VRIVCISDTHDLHRELVVPRGDLLIHAGDFTFLSQRPSMLRDFDKWLSELPHRHKVVVPGNHDYILEEPSNRWQQITHATLLVDSGLEIEGIRIWGSPVTPLYGGAFGQSSPADRKRHWAQIPDDIDILITHGPPFGILDGEPHEGCPELREAVLRVKPRLHVFGHVHAGYGISRAKHTLFVNAALFEDGEVGRRPIVLGLSRN
jgi:Icc-related predicted phosphoesterase